MRRFITRQEVSQQAQQMTQLGASRLQGLQGIHLGGLVGEEARVAGVGHDGRALPGDQARPVFQGGVAGSAVVLTSLEFWMPFVVGPRSYA